MASVRGPGLYEFLIEAELQQYYAGIKNDLKVQNVPQLKYVTEDDLHSIGMSKPEMRRLNKFFQKHFPQNYLSKLKKMILPGRKGEEQVASMLAMLPDEGPEKPPIKVPNKHIIPAEAIIVNKELGTGEFGVVQQGVWTNDGERIQVAIKCLSRERMQNNPIEFLKEAAIMHAIDHEHIVRLYGVVLDTGALMLVTELAPLRSLLECLKEPSLRSSFPVLSLCDFAIQICDGMQYLEAKRLIHRDLAARNILVFSKNKVKISDFGLSRALGVGKDYYQTNFNVNLKLPIAWCAPECISYLRFTSASDVWAYGVTLWEVFSYGFQPWAALTGHQILEAIDEPNLQRLEQPECCPKEYYNVMLRCWQHDPNKRPRFSDLINILPECKPEQVQAVQDCVEEPSKLKRDQLLYHVGDIITVLDKGPLPNGVGCWKGVLNSGKTGFFNPAHTVAYLGSNLPASSKPGEFVRGDGKNTYSSKRRLRPEMISGPQGDLKHTGHVGLDGSYFGDMSFLGGKQYQHLPHQVVAPYKPQEDTELMPRPDVSDRAPLLKPLASTSSDDVKPKLLTDHEYHEISDEENVVTADSPCFEKDFDLGPSLLDELEPVILSLGSTSPPPPPSPLDETTNVRNELKEMATKVSGKKKQAMVKPISASDQKTLENAIAMANELAARSMNGLDGGLGVNSMTGVNTPPESPHTPGRRKFSFRFPSTGGSIGGGNKGSGKHEIKRTFSEEAASIPDIQSSLSEEARAVYNSLVEQPAIATVTAASSPTNSAETNPLRMLRAGHLPVVVRPRVRVGNRGYGQPQPQPRLRVPPPPLIAPPPLPASSRSLSGGQHSELDENTSQHSRLSREISASPEHSSCEDECNCSTVTSSQAVGQNQPDDYGSNPIPLPPRDRSRPLAPSKPRHQRKHPLIIPGGGVSRTLARVAGVSEDDTNPVSNKECIGCCDENDEENGSHFLTDRAKHSSDACDDESGDDSFERHIASELEALDDMEEDTLTTNHNSQYGNSEARSVSCEDLLDFACDTPSARRTAGPARGSESDEVRIMRKVLGEEIAGSPEQCVAALETASWDVHRAIKLCRLHSLLPGSSGARDDIGNNRSNQQWLFAALEASGWDVARALMLLRQEDPTTQV